MIVGEHDQETPIAYAQALADGLRRAELRVIAEAGHLTPAEAPEAFNELVSDFLLD